MPPGHSLQTGFVRSDTGVPQQANLDASGNVQVNVVGGGGTGGGPATIADGADVAEGSTADVAWVSGAGTVISLLKKIASGGGGSAVSIADGSDVAEGTTTDTAITSDTSGTVIGFLRGVVKMLASVWDSVNGRLKVDGSAVTQPVSQGAPAQTSVTWFGGFAPIGTTLSLPMTGYSTVIAELVANSIVGGAVTFDGSIDGVSWTTVEGYKSALAGLPLTSIALLGGSGLYRINAIGLNFVRVRVTSNISGNSEFVSLQASAAPTAYSTVSQGTAQVTSANAWWVKSAQIPTSLGAAATAASMAVNIASDQVVPISATALPLPTGAATATAQTDRTQKAQLTDGTRDGTVKAASTLPLATDTAVVVTLRDAVTTTPPANASTNVAQLAGTATSVNSGVKDAGTLRVVLATDQPALNNKLLVTPDSVALPANQSVNAAQFGGTNVATGTGASGAGVPRVTVANDSNVIVTPPTLTKGTQSATGFSTQDLKDSGRNQTNYFMAAPVACTTAEVMQSLTGYKSGAAVGATVTPAVVTSGKTYRIDKIKITIIAVTAIGSARVNLRANLSGSGVVGSPLVMSYQVGIPAIFTAGSAETYSFDYSEGMEFPAGTGLAIGVIGEGADGTTGTAVAKVMVSLHGYEY